MRTKKVGPPLWGDPTQPKRGVSCFFKLAPVLCAADQSVTPDSYMLSEPIRNVKSLN